MTDPQNIDAEYMNRWLGESSAIRSLSPKTLYDVQTLLEYYRDIIVPGSKVSISFPVEKGNTSPRASIEHNEVIIPLYLLQEGRVDHTIGAMIHELHHIKLSPSERFIQNTAFRFLRGLMQNIDCGGMTLAERVFCDSGVSRKAIFSNSPDASNDVLFLRNAISDLLFLMNAVEDVRIDANTPPNLRKYIDKVDNTAKGRLKEMFEKGELDVKEISSLGLLLLGHHKGMFESEEIAKRFGDTDRIVNGDPLSLSKELFVAFQEEIAYHIRELYFKYCGKPKAENTQNDLDVSFDLDAYFGDKVEGAVGQGIEDEFSSMPVAESQNTQDAMSEDHALSSGSEELKELGKQAAEALKNSDAEKEKAATQQAFVVPVDAPAKKPMSAAEAYRIEVEDKKKDVFMDSALSMQVKSFRDVQVITTTEHFDNQKVVYDTVLFDTLNQ